MYKTYQAFNRREADDNRAMVNAIVWAGRDSCPRNGGLDGAKEVLSFQQLVPKSFYDIGIATNVPNIADRTEVDSRGRKSSSSGILGERSEKKVCSSIVGLTGISKPAYGGSKYQEEVQLLMLQGAV